MNPVRRILAIVLIACTGVLAVLAVYSFMRASNTNNYAEEIATTSAKGPYQFIVLADTHCGSGELDGKKPLRDRILFELAQANGAIKAVIFAGDLIQNGSAEEFDEFKSMWIEPLEKFMASEPFKGVYLGFGNHDDLEGDAVRDYIKDRYGAPYYTFDIGPLHFMHCGKYPEKTLCGKDVQDWMGEYLQQIPPAAPVVLISHYNLMGPYSDWWGQGLSTPFGDLVFLSDRKAKDSLYDLLEGRNIKCFFCGHWHRDYSTHWRETVPVAGVGGDCYALCNYDPEEDSLQVVFKDAAGEVRSWDDLFISSRNISSK